MGLKDAPASDEKRNGFYSDLEVTSGNLCHSPGRVPELGLAILHQGQCQAQGHGARGRGGTET